VQCCATNVQQSTNYLSVFLSVHIADYSIP
jgi:hypothetical protein